MSTQLTHTPSRHGWAPEWTFADRIRRIRRDIHISQEQFAQKLNVNANTYKAWESGRNEPEDIVAVAKRIWLFTGVPSAWTLDVINDENPAGDDPTGQPGPSVEGGPGCAPRDSNPEPIDSGSNVVPLFGGVAA